MIVFPPASLKHLAGRSHLESIDGFSKTDRPRRSNAATYSDGERILGVLSEVERVSERR